MPTPEPLDLLSLARTDPGVSKLVPGTGLKVQALNDARPLRLERPVWLAVLSGELLVDLPYGDFRRLGVGDSIQLEAGLELTFTPLEDTVILHTSSLHITP